MHKGDEEEQQVEILPYLTEQTPAIEPRDIKLGDRMLHQQNNQY